MNKKEKNDADHIELLNQKLKIALDALKELVEWKYEVGMKADPDAYTFIYKSHDPSNLDEICLDTACRCDIVFPILKRIEEL